MNLKGLFFCPRAVAGPMKARGEGAIVNSASVAGLRAVGSSIAYAASKAGPINLTVALVRVLAWWTAATASGSRLPRAPFG